MLTPQDIGAKEFPKAVFGGYDMTAVDDFLEELQADYTTLYKDNVSLKSKLKILVDKVEEYRSTEDAMRMALLTAQKMSDDMIAETQQKCDEMLRQAEIEASSKKNSINEDITLETQRLEAAKEETAKFVAASKKLVEDQARFLLNVDKFTHEMLKSSPRTKAVPDEPIRSPEPEPGRRPAPAQRRAEPEPDYASEAETQEEIENVVSDIMNEVSDELSGGPAGQVSRGRGAQDTDFQDEYGAEEYSSIDVNTKVYDPGLDETKRVPTLHETQPGETNPSRLDWTAEDEEITPRPKFKFDDLQFGSNYKD